MPENATARYYVMEFIEARPQDALASRRLSVDEAVELGVLIDASSNCCGSISCMATLSPRTFSSSATTTLRFKLVDLGSAGDFLISTRAGTASYLAPERFHGTRSRAHRDLSIGVTLSGAHRRSPLRRNRTLPDAGIRPGKAPTRLNPNIPPWLEAVILRAIVVDPADLSALRTRLRSRESGEGGTILPTGRLVWRRTRCSSTRRVSTSSRNHPRPAREAFSH